MTAIVILLSAPDDADVVARLVGARFRALPTDGVVVERPPDALLGLGFLAHPDEARAWWDGSRAATATRWIMVIDHMPSVASEIDGVESTWIVWCRDPAHVAAYDGLPNAWPTRSNDVRGVADAVVEWCAQDRQLARFVRPTWGPFQRVGNADADPRLRVTPLGDGDVEVARNSAGLDDAPAQVATHRDPLVVGPPPVERVSVSSTGSSPRTDGTGTSRPHGDGAGDPGRARAAVPPPPPLTVMPFAPVPALSALDRAAIPAPPPVTDEPNAVPSTGDRDGMPVPPAPPPRGKGDRGLEVDVGEPAVRRDAAPGGEATTVALVQAAQPESGPSHLPPAPVHAEMGDADCGRDDQPPAEIVDLAAAQVTPLDGLPILEPPQTVAEVAERGPRQVGLSWLPGSLVGKRRRRAQGAGVGRDRAPTQLVDAVRGSVITTRPTVEMTEPELRGEAARLLMLGPPLVVVCSSRKGGVGKTYDVLGVAELADEAGEAFAVRSVLLEQNLENPDLRVVLGLPGATSTVRQLDRALADGVEAPPAAHPTQSSLSVYVEERETGSYPRESIERMARHCRARYGLTAVDLANCLPDVTGGKAAAVVAHWLRAADVVMLPTDASRSGLKGLAEMIDEVRAQAHPAARLAPGIVIPFLVQPGGRALEYPGIAEVLERYNGQGAQPVAVPFSEQTQLAGWENPDGERTTILGDDDVRLAYWRLLVAVLRAGNARGQP